MYPGIHSFDLVAVPGVDITIIYLTFPYEDAEVDDENQEG